MHGARGLPGPGSVLPTRMRGRTLRRDPRTARNIVRQRYRLRRRFDLRRERALCRRAPAARRRRQCVHHRLLRSDAGSAARVAADRRFRRVHGGLVRPRYGEIAHTTLPVDDGNDCTKDSCDPRAGLKHEQPNPVYTCQAACAPAFTWPRAVRASSAVRPGAPLVLRVELRSVVSHVRGELSERLQADRCVSRRELRHDPVDHGLLREGVADKTSQSWKTEITIGASGEVPHKQNRRGRRRLPSLRK